MEFILPDEIKQCIFQLENRGFEAFCVGGAVRDHIIGTKPGDYDVTTNALPEDIISIFEKTVPTGIKHGTVTVIINKIPIEITTYRTESDYVNHRSPESVNFVNNINGDLKRRDFTMNAICYHPINGIYDPLNGTEDIKSKTIRSVGNAEKRFEEDALRILRAFRFSAQLGFELEPQTLNAASNKAQTLSLISVERIAEELKKAFTADNPQKLNPLFSSNGLFHIGIDKNSVIPSYFNNSPCDFSIRFSFFCKENSLNSSEILTNLKFDNSTKNAVQKYDKMLCMKCRSESDIRRLLNIGDLELTKKYLTFVSPEKLSLLDKIISRGDAYKISMLNISGNDLLEQGIQAIHIGKTLENLLEAVIKDPSLNTKEILKKTLNLSR